MPRLSNSRIAAAPLGIRFAKRHDGAFGRMPAIIRQQKITF
jgi:hypothetical protein